MLPYQTIRSSRRTACIQIRNGQVIVRVPKAMSQAQIEEFVCKHQSWIDKHLARAEKTADKPTAPKFTPEELRALAEKAKQVIPERVRYYAPQIGVTYGRITIRSQRSRWGSCSAKGNLNFNCLLMLTPPEVVDSIVVHELCHRKEMNHSKRFYDEVLKAYPEYRKWNDWLKKHGNELIQRLP